MKNSLVGLLREKINDSYDFSIMVFERYGSSEWRNMLNKFVSSIGVDSFACNKQRLKQLVRKIKLVSQSSFVGD